MPLALAQADTGARDFPGRSEHGREAIAFEIDVLACPRCASPVRVLATIDDARVIGEILTHLSLPSDEYGRDHAQPPPELFADA